MEWDRTGETEGENVGDLCMHTKQLQLVSLTEDNAHKSNFT